MPIDIMSPIQALQHSAMAYKGVKESEKHLKLQEQKLDIDKQKADTYKEAVSKQLNPEQKLEKTRIEQEGLNFRAHEATKQNNALARKSKFDMMAMQYRDNDNEMADRATKSLEENQSAIINNQPNLKVGEE